MPTALTGKTRTVERTKTLSMTLLYKAAPIREVVRDRSTLTVSGFITNVAGRLRLLSPRLLVSTMSVFSKASPVRLDPRLRATLGQVGVTSASLRMTLRLAARAIGTELATVFPVAEVRSEPQVRGRLRVLFPITAAAGTLRLDERLRGVLQQSGFLVPITAQVRVSPRLRGTTTLPGTTGNTPVRGTAREWEHVIGFRSKIVILRRRYVFLGSSSPDQRYPTVGVGSPGSRYQQIVTDTAGVRYVPPTFEDPSLTPQSPPVARVVERLVIVPLVTGDTTSVMGDTTRVTGDGFTWSRP